MNDLAYDPAGHCPLKGDASDSNAPHWTEYHIGFCHPTGLGRFAAGSVPLLVSELQQSGSVLSAFFVRKTPGLRLRLCWAQRPAEDPVLTTLQLEALVASDIFLPPRPMPHYREVELFGGFQGAAAVEAFFSADSAFVLSLACKPAAVTDPLALSFALIDRFFRAAAADEWELWAMWRRLADLRGGGDAALLTPPPAPPESAERSSVETAAILCAERVRALAQKGCLDQPLRSILPIVAAYHLNRMGYDAAVQAALASGAAAAKSPHQPKPGPPVLASIGFERVPLGPIDVFDQPDLDAAVALGGDGLSAWHIAAAESEAALMRLAASTTHAPALVTKSDRPLQGVLNLLTLPPAARRKGHRRDLDTICNLIWRYAGRPTPFADLAATRVFDPTDPMRPGQRISSDVEDDSLFARDRFDLRPPAPFSAAMGAAIKAAATAFSAADAPGPSPNQRALAWVLDHVGQGKTLSLAEGAACLTALAHQLGLPVQMAAQPRILAMALGQDVDDWPMAPSESGAGQVSLSPSAKEQGAGTERDLAEVNSVTSPRRVALLLQEGRDGVALDHFGADRMCWFARYLPRGDGPSHQTLRNRAATWLAHWPETVDVTVGQSTHPLDDHNPLTWNGASLQEGQSFLSRAENGLYDLIDANGLPLHAVHFGVSSTGALSIAAQIALLAGSRVPSFGEWALAVANRRIARHLAKADPDRPTMMPWTDLHGALILSGTMLAVPTRLPALARAAAGDPRQMWDALSQAGLRPGAMMVNTAGNPGYRVLDLRLSSGLRTLCRMAGRDPMGWLFVRPLRRLPDGKLGPEYYVELTATPSDRRKGMAPWT